MKRHVAGQLGNAVKKTDIISMQDNLLYSLRGLESRLVIKFGCMLIAALFLFWAANHLPRVLIEEPFYLMVGVIAVFAAGLVVFFTTRDDRLMR